jgi:hypothetical protein
MALFWDHTGVASRHSARTIQFMWPVHERAKRLPPWRWLPEWLTLLSPRHARESLLGQVVEDELGGLVLVRRGGHPTAVPVAAFSRSV